MCKNILDLKQKYQTLCGMTGHIMSTALRAKCANIAICIEEGTASCQRWFLTESTAPTLPPTFQTKSNLTTCLFRGMKKKKKQPLVFICPASATPGF